MLCKGIVEENMWMTECTAGAQKHRGARQKHSQSIALKAYFPSSHFHQPGSTYSLFKQHQQTENKWPRTWASRAHFTFKRQRNEAGRHAHPGSARFSLSLDQGPNVGTAVLWLKPKKWKSIGFLTLAWAWRSDFCLIAVSKGKDIAKQKERGKNMCPASVEEIRSHVLVCVETGRG